MSKAEDYIRKNTNNQANISIEISNGGKMQSCSQPWLTPDDARKAVEIAKEEMMEKAIDAELYSDGMLIPLIGVNDKEVVKDIKFGDKIKLIIIKDKKDI